MRAARVDRDSNTHTNIKTYIPLPPPPPDHSESTLKCNNERGNKLIIPISSLFMRAGSTVSSYHSKGVLWGIAECSCTPHTVVTVFLQNIWPCTMGRRDLRALYILSAFIVLRFLFFFYLSICFSAIGSSVFLKSCWLSGIFPLLVLI